MTTMTSNSMYTDFSHMYNMIDIKTTIPPIINKQISQGIKTIYDTIISNSDYKYFTYILKLSKIDNILKQSYINLVNAEGSISLFTYDKDLKTKEEMEKNGWDGTDLNEKQLNILTIISDLYLKRNKSKYKVIETPSEIINWFSQWIQSIFTKNELKWKE